MNARIKGGQDVAPVIATRIDDWRRRLIDLSFRNRLINYRPTKSSTLELISPTIHELLVDPERTEPFDFFIPPEQMRLVNALCAFTEIATGEAP